MDEFKSADYMILDFRRSAFAEYLALPYHLKSEIM
jgi:hypothetical protein